MDKIELSIKKLKELYKKYNDKVGLCATDILGFDLCFDTLEKEIKELQEFARIVSKNIKIEHNTIMSDSVTICHTCYNEVTHKAEFNLVKKVVEKYGK